jgi:hypothetical protein
MSTLGYTGSPGSSNTDFSTYAGAQYGQELTMPTGGGLITDLHVYAQTESGSSHAGYLVLWSSGGSVLASHSCTIPGSIAYINETLATPYFMAGGTTFFVGVQTTDTGTSGLYMQYNSTSGTIDWGHNSGAPSSLANILQDTSRQLGAYVTYNPGGAWIWNGSAWVIGECVINQGTPASPNWQPGALGMQVYNGSTWNTGN